MSISQIKTLLTLQIRAGYPIISIETHDEPRAVEVARDVAEELCWPVFEWSITTGLQQGGPEQRRADDEEPLLPDRKPATALQYARDAEVASIYIFKDLGLHLQDLVLQRLVRDVEHGFRETGSALILIDAGPLPDSVRRLALMFEVSPPSYEELDQVVRKTFKAIDRGTHEEVQAKISKRAMEQLVHSLRGLNATQAARIVATVVHDDMELNDADLPRVIQAKRLLLASSGCLESIATDLQTEDVGGLKNLKSWLKQRRGGYSQKAREFGIDQPRGVLMLGVQGCGKSLCAKAVASEWSMPLLRLDPGVLYQKFIGESESQLRKALRQAEAMAPVVLWIDEIEKAFASASASSADGGLSQRIFGTLLTWMQDHREPIFLIATANDISALPPELMRKGRFDEVFFVDLPDSLARQNIFAIHLRRRNRDPAKFNLEALAAASAGFSGAEIEQAIVSGLYRAFSQKTELTDATIQTEIASTRPLSVLLAEKIARLREWARDRCVPAD